MLDGKTLIFIPTFNERENVEKLFNEITNLNLNLDILFIDDNSPDGTGNIMDSIAKKHTNVHVIHRSGKFGIGSAHFDGINWAYDHKYKILITMDCDFTHSPKYILDFILKSENYDIVVGSRYLSSKCIEEWDLLRKILTSTGHILTRHMLKMDYDATGAYRLYNLDKIPQNIFSLIRSSGYSFFFESLYILNINQFSIREIGISLPARNLGHSKVTIKQILLWGKNLFHLFLLTIFNKNRLKNPEESKRNGWENYWTKKISISGIVYDSIAVFYRKNIIKKNLNYFIEKNFHAGSRLLHAGCGSGEVDTDIAGKNNIISLDLSISALTLNRTKNNHNSSLIQGTIFLLPLSDSSFDGIYNLGVMEHFTENDINLILREYKRVLKSNGKIILFWAPEFGSSVIFLKCVHFVLNRVFWRNIKLHPHEITRIRSKNHIKNIIDMAGLKIIDKSFSVRDLFTYYVVTCDKFHEEPV